MNALKFHPLTPDRWADFEALFGLRGACGGCWCMYWRQTHSEYEAQKGETNKRAMKALVQSGQVPGILAYDGDRPVGWCSLAPREDYARLSRSRILKRVDDKLVWSIVCFVVASDQRRKGIQSALVHAAVDFATSNGATIVEAYPVEPKKDSVPDLFVFTGLASAFTGAGFEEVARRSETRPIMRMNCAIQSLL